MGILEMKKLNLVANGEFMLVDQTLPRLQRGSCRVKISYSGICSSDVERALGGGAYNYPLVMGHELSGSVIEQGEGCEKNWINKKVVVFPLKPCFDCFHCKNSKYMRCLNYDYYGSRSDGGFASFLDVEEWNLLEMPKNIDPKDSCLTEPCSVVHHAIKKFTFPHEKDEIIRVCIIGCGFLGLVAADMFKIMYPKSHITIMDRNEFKLRKCVSADVKICIARENTDTITIEKNFRQSFDMVLEATGSVDAISLGVSLIKSGGEVVLMGNMKTGINLNRSTVDALVRREITIKGTWNSDYKCLENDDWLATFSLFLKGFRPSNYVTNTIDLEQIPDILQRRKLHAEGAAQSDIVKAVCKID